MEKYIISPALRKAVDIARFLKKPLLLCGEPGTGKTRLAHYLADVLSRETTPGKPAFAAEPFVFNTKTTSVASDLFYSYDGLGRLRDAYNGEKNEKIDYISFNAFGKAILFSGNQLPQYLRDKAHLLKPPFMPSSSVVLIDEVDKAPRDFPNDILTEIEKYNFHIKELGEDVTMNDTNAEIMVIMTSNNEKNFPDAFLRRCVFHYIDFPNETELKQIIDVHLAGSNMANNGTNNGQGGEQPPADMNNVVRYVNEMRTISTVKKPSTSEILDWVKFVTSEGLLHYVSNTRQDLGEHRAVFKSSLGILFKNYFDLKLAEEKMLSLHGRG